MLHNAASEDRIKNIRPFSSFEQKIYPRCVTIEET